MTINEQFERLSSWIEKQMREGDKCGRLYSLVYVVGKKDKVRPLRILSIKQKKLCLEDHRGCYFCVAPSDVKNVAWSRRGLLMQLSIEVAQTQYRLRFSARESEEIVGNYAPKNWFGELFPVLFVNIMRLFARGRDMAEANFAEAEKWRDVFPNAEFPNTQINAKS